MADYFSTATTGGGSGQPIYIVITLPAELINFGKNLEKKLPGVLHRIGMEGKSFWKSEAGRKLKSTRNEYVQAIKYKRIDNLSFYLLLEGEGAQATENGYDKFDMKPGLRASPNYRPTPIRTKDGRKKKFPRAIAAKLPQKSPASMFMIIPLNSKTDKNKAGEFVKGKPYITMTKPKVYRTITNLTPDNKWMHKGFKGVHLLDSVIDEVINKIVPKHVKIMIKDILKNGNRP